MILLHRCYISFKRPPFDPSHQEEFNGGNFISIRSLKGEKIEKVLKNQIKKVLVSDMNYMQG